MDALKKEIVEENDQKKLKDLCYRLIFVTEQIGNLDVIFGFLDSLKEN